MAASIYCKKENNFWEGGVIPVDQEEDKENKRAEWERTWNYAKEGKIEEISPDKRIRYYNAFKGIEKDYGCKPGNLPGVCGYWVCGPTGTGKTFAVMSKYPELFIKDSSKWWDSYRGEDVVLLDDLDPDSSVWIARFLKVWGDKYPFVGQTKGGAKCIRPKKFVVTSNYSIDMFGFRPQDVEAIKRRFIVIEKNNKEQSILI